MSTERESGAGPRRVVIVGAGHGGSTVATLLRQQGFDGEVMVIGDEPVDPYHRPPLSKSLLAGELEQPLQPQEYFAENRIELRRSTPVVGIDREAGAVQLHDGTSAKYDVLVLATGAKARRLPIPGMELERVYELRSLKQARVLHDALTPGRRLAIVGGGWIGLEVAASARSAGVDVTVIEREERLLARVASAELSRRLTEHHLERGTKIVTSAEVSALERGPRWAVGSVVLRDGRTIECDRVLVGVGAVANDEIARAAGLACEDGVVVDSCARTGDPRIFAVGDVTRRPLIHRDGLFRLESIPSAVEQARQAVASILGEPAPEPEVPWFWSDQFDLKLQIAGLLAGADAVTVREDPGTGRLALFHSHAGRLLAVEAVNAPGEFMAGKQLIRDRVELDLDQLADPAVGLGELAGMQRAPAATEAPAEAPAVASAPEIEREPGAARVTFVHDGEATTVNAGIGATLMEASVRNNLPGIIAECGGMCSCGTCHVHVEPEWLGQLPDPEYEESDMLEFLEGVQPNSRLSCQIVVEDGLDGLVVRVPGA
jgi:3-phenylpropionate/trans-cinnamate dioxygenase ferredoxin reductase component